MRSSHPLQLCTTERTTRRCSACDAVSARFGGGVLLDIHGQSTTIDAIYRGTCQGLSCHHLLQKHGPSVLTGPTSFFGILAARGYKILPRAFFGTGIGTETKFRGGFICHSYGTQHQPLIDSFQLETGSNFRTTNVRVRAKGLYAWLKPALLNALPIRPGPI